MPTRIQCAITKGNIETTFEFMLPEENVTVTIPRALNDEQCETVIQCFVDTIAKKQSKVHGVDALPEHIDPT